MCSNRIECELVGFGRICVLNVKGIGVWVFGVELGTRCWGVYGGVYGGEL